MNLDSSISGPSSIPRTIAAIGSSSSALEIAYPASCFGHFSAALKTRVTIVATAATIEGFTPKNRSFVWQFSRMCRPSSSDSFVWSWICMNRVRKKSGVANVVSNRIALITWISIANSSPLSKLSLRKLDSDARLRRIDVLDLRCSQQRGASGNSQFVFRDGGHGQIAVEDADEAVKGVRCESEFVVEAVQRIDEHITVAHGDLVCAN
jgi:hypothetical protein